MASDSQCHLPLDFQSFAPLQSVDDSCDEGWWLIAGEPARILPHRGQHEACVPRSFLIAKKEARNVSQVVATLE